MPVPGPTSDSRSDAELVSAINAGDARAFDALYLRYRDWAASLAFRFIGDRDLALDVMQETFIYLLRKFPGFTLTAQMKTFLYPVVRHLAIAAAQKSRKLTTGVDDEAVLQQIAAPSEPSAGKSGDASDLAAVLAVLPLGQREVLMLRFVDDLPLQEIAAAMGLPLGTVKSRLHLGLAALREDDRTKKYFGV
jgi:RNA polymerase sigma-70 factor (ECF subfamily)